MLLLVPLGAVEGEPRWPRVTAALVALNVLCLLLTSGAAVARSDEQLAELERIAEYSLRGLPTATQQRARSYSSPLAFVEQDGLWWSEAGPGIDRERLETCRSDARRLRQGHPFYRFGFVPAEPWLVRLLTHQFLHADFLHLLFNMLFLWTAGGLVEATLGPAVFGGLYLSGGFAAALAHAAARPGSFEPAIGASGAVAGIMGAAAVLHFREPIRIALVAGLGLAPRISLLSMPVAVVLGLWLLEQLFMAAFRSASLNVAFEAHLGGFAFGALAALAWRARGAARGRVGAPATSRRAAEPATRRSRPSTSRSAR